MSDTDGKFEHESLQDRAAVSRYLKAIEEGFANGSLSLKGKDGNIVLEPQGLIDLSVQASRKRGRMQLSLKMNWKTKDQPKGNSPDTLTITTNGT